jgi:hypothetical protein
MKVVILSGAGLLVLIGIILIIVSAFPKVQQRVPEIQFWNLGWGFVLAGLLLVPM